MHPSARKPKKAPLSQYQDLNTSSSSTNSTPTPTPTPTFTPTSASTPISISTPASTSTPTPTPTPSRRNSRPPRPPLKANTSESLLSSDHATDNTPSSDTTITDLGDDFDTDFVHVTTEDYTEGLKDEDSSRGTSTTTSSTGCAITFSSAFGASSSSSSEFEHIESIWGWDATRGSCAAGAPSTPPKAKAEKIDGEEGGNDTPPLLGDALALVAEAEASAAADLNRSVPRPRQARAARKKLPTLDTPIVYPLGEMKHSFRNVYRKLRQNERRMKKVQRKLHIYKAEIEYLKGKRRRIWNML